MTRTSLMVVLTLLICSTTTLSQTQNKQVALNQDETQLIALSREAVDAGIAKEIVVVEDPGSGAPSETMGRAVVRGKYDAVELTDTKLRVAGDLAVVTGRVLFKGGLPEWHTKESSSGVTIRFTKRGGRWEFVGMCIGKCDAE